MTYVYHHRTAGRGGEAVHITSVVRALRAAGHTVELISPPGADPFGASNDVPLDKGAPSVTGISRLWKSISCAFPQSAFEVIEILYNVYAVVRLVPLFRRRDVDVYYERYAFFLSAGVWLAKLFGKTVLLEVNEVVGLRRARGQSFPSLARWLERRTFAGADHILTVSSVLRAEVLRRGGRPGHVHVVLNAIEPGRFQGRTHREEMRTRLGLTGAPVLGFAGWFDRWDRLDRLVELTKALRPEYPGIRLLLVGDGPVAEDITQQIRRDGLEGVVVLSGPVVKDDVPDYIDAMDICILPDSNEFGSPIVLFEFMAMAKAVIAPDVQPVRDVVVDGETALVIERRDQAALTIAAKRLLDDPIFAHSLGTAAQRLVFERHTWSAVGRIVERLSIGSAERYTQAPVRVETR